ncbi:VOC family protein [Rhodococcus rhodnii]|uniref:VOC domain-containing protein n=1 Tax=Rhodococcus rhodnii LMG 5362 TaxID=1273125 RepID=R7WT63_9NOCA|nr:VOC family protein [Rhodococcus rhodnii]EOM78457.1 hypothetical protein Rrhod_0288 [Rhodococcus rhodnii LMG 5362]
MTGPAPDGLRVPVADPAAAAQFYADVLGADLVGNGATVDLHGTGTVEFVSAEHPLSRFPRVVVTYVLDQPSEVEDVTGAASARGAEILKPAKKALFGSFSGTFRAPDGLVWKLASDKRKDNGRAASEPKPIETSLILGVREPTASRSFYTSLGMQTDRDYGNKYIDFVPAPGTARLCSMPGAALAKDVGVADSSEASDVAFVHRTSAAEAERLLAAAATAGGHVLPDASGAQAFADPDGFRWLVVTQ